MASINYTDKLNGSMKQIDIDELEQQLLTNYKPSRKAYGGKGLSLYEYIELKDETIKMYFDFDKKLTFEEEKEFDEDEYEEKLIEGISTLFQVEHEDINISCDNRPKEDHHKISYHVILDKTIKNSVLLKLLPKLKKAFELIDYELDTSVYKTGLQKFRIPCCKKHNPDHSIEKNSLLRPITNVKDIRKHIIQWVEGVEELDIELLTENLNVVLKDQIKAIEYQNGETIQDILATFDIISEKDCGDYKAYNVNCECPFAHRTHKSNHCYLIDCGTTLYMKCHDEDCSGRVKVLYKNTDTNTIEFDMEVFNNLDTYEEKREYFEKYYKYLRDSNTLYRLQNIYNRKYDYYEKDLQPVDKAGLMDLYYQEENKKGKMENKSFIKKYMGDPKKQFLFNIIFNPDKDKNDKYYNLFNGFNYQSILNMDDEITDEDRDDFKFYLDYIKKHICSDNEDWFKYFIGHFALIIQQPSFLNHIIFLFYSSKQRTGKSNFLKFISRVFGMNYCYFGSFNQILDNPHTTAHLGTFINIIEEINFTDASKCEGQIKDYSQRESGIYNPKGKTEIKVNTYVRYFGTSNNPNALKITDEDQRIVVWEFQKVEDKKYVDRLEKVYDNKKMIYLFGEYLREFKLPHRKRNDWILNRPITTAYLQMVHNDSIKSFLKDLYNCENIFEEDQYTLLQLNNCMNKRNNSIFKISTTKLYEYYTKYCSLTGLKPFASTNFSKALITRTTIIKKKTGGNMKYIINMECLKNDLKITEEYVNHILQRINQNESDSETESD